MDADVIVVEVFVMDATTEAFCELKMTQWYERVKVLGISYIQQQQVLQSEPSPRSRSPVKVPAVRTLQSSTSGDRKLNAPLPLPLHKEGYPHKTHPSWRFFLPGETLERRTLWIYAQRHSSRLQLLRNELVHFLCKEYITYSGLESSHSQPLSCSLLTLDLLYRRHFPLPIVVERLRRGRLKVHHVLPHSGRGRKAALAHARVVPQPPLVQVRMRQGVRNRDPLVL